MIRGAEPVLHEKKKFIRAEPVLIEKDKFLRGEPVLRKKEKIIRKVELVFHEEDVLAERLNCFSARKEVLTWSELVLAELFFFFYLHKNMNCSLQGRGL